MTPLHDVGSSSGSTVSKWWECVWKLLLPSKIEPFLWRLFHGILPVAKSLASR
ncbi:hypothetical protein TorRG33x02_296230, partial [Trema orientale]